MVKTFLLKIGEEIFDFPAIVRNFQIFYRKSLQTLEPENNRGSCLENSRGLWWKIDLTIFNLIE